MVIAGNLIGFNNNLYCLSVVFGIDSWIQKVVDLISDLNNYKKFIKNSNFIEWYYMYLYSIDDVTSDNLSWFKCLVFDYLY